MLTLKKLKEMEPGIIFEKGVCVDNPNGINMSNSGKELRWVAVRGSGFHDWAIYIHYSYNDEGWIKRYGDKVNNNENIKKLVKCDNEAFELYRH